MSQPSDLAFETVERLREAAQVSDVLREMRRAGAAFGYDAFIISNLPTEDLSTRDCALLPSWPEAWRRHYFERDYLRVDPVVRHVRRATEPFLWSEVPRLADAAAAARVMGEATEFGLLQGLCVPIHQGNGQSGGVSFGAARLDLSEKAKAALHLVSMYAYQKTDALIRAAGGLAPRGNARLSPREVECLRWTAAGKTSWEASEIMRTSQRTVEFHLRNAARKLQAVNRVQCIAEAMRQGIIA